MTKKVMMRCAWCKRVRNSQGGQYVVGTPVACMNVSDGICPECAEWFKATEEIGKYVPLLKHFPSYTCEEIREAQLTGVGFVPELNSRGFTLKFQNGIKLGLEVFQDVFFYKAFDGQYCNYSGMAMPQNQAREAYNQIVDILLALPPRPTPIA